MTTNAESCVTFADRNYCNKYYQREILTIRVAKYFIDVSYAHIFRMFELLFLEWKPSSHLNIPHLANPTIQFPSDTIVGH
jgi:hypothetical protein